MEHHALLSLTTEKLEQLHKTILMEQKKNTFYSEVSTGILGVYYSRCHKYWIYYLYEEYRHGYTPLDVLPKAQPMKYLENDVMWFIYVLFLPPPFCHHPSILFSFPGRRSKDYLIFTIAILSLHVEPHSVKYVHAFIFLQI